MSIFLAEDDEDDVQLFRDAIAVILGNPRVVVSGNGEKLMMLLAGSLALPDIIFLDLNMPLKDGYQCLQEIKSNPLWKSIKTVVLSTTSDDREIKKCYDLGADIFVVKSSRYSDFELNLRRCLT